MTERKMFGGLMFMVAGHICRRVLNDDLAARVEPDRYQTGLVPIARPIAFTDKQT